MQNRLPSTGFKEILAKAPDAEVDEREGRLSGMVVGSTLIGGISAEITGGDISTRPVRRFWQGALQAETIVAFNQRPSFTNVGSYLQVTYF